jgi:hypothetical protein
MNAAEFRLNNGVVEYRTLIFRGVWIKSEDGYEYQDASVEDGYTEWMPFPVAKTATVTSLSPYDCGTRRV